MKKRRPPSPPHIHWCINCFRLYGHKNGECRGFDDGWCGCIKGEEWLREVAPWLAQFKTTAMLLAERMIGRRGIY